MTRQQAIELENKCEKLMSEYLGNDCTVSMALSGRFKVSFGENYITLEKDNKSASCVKFRGYYSDLEEYVGLIVRCIDENKDIFDELICSYGYCAAIEALEVKT